MTNFNGASVEEQVKKLLEQNLAYSKQIYLLTRQTKTYILWGRVMSFISIMLIVIPLILGVIYLPGLFNNYVGSLVPTADGAENQNGSHQDLLKTIKDQGGLLKLYQNILDLQNQ